MWMLGVGLLLTGVATAEETPETDPAVQATVEATLSEDSSLLTGTVTLHITNDTGIPLTRIPLWLYPNRFAEINSQLNEGMRRWFYPKGVSRGGMTIANPRWGGVGIDDGSIAYRSLYVGGASTPDMIAEVPLCDTLQPGVSGALEVDFEVRIPARRGRFGRHRHVVMLAGDWFPRPLTDLTGRDDQIPSDVIRADIHLAVPDHRGAVVGDRVFALTEHSRVITVRGLLTESVPVIVMDRMEVAKRSYPWGEAVHVHQDLPWHPATWKETLDDKDGNFGRLPEPGRFNRSERLFDIVGHTASLIHTLAPNTPLRPRVLLVDIPAWDRMVQTGPGPVLISDRLWRLLPVEGAIFFHDLAVVRTLSAELVWQDVLSLEPPRDRFVGADVIGTFMKAHYSKEIHQKHRTVEDLVGFASIFPTIDNLLYAPQIPFREVYFPSVEEPDPFRDEPWYFMNQLPRGKRILGKLEDLVGEDGAGELVREMLRGTGRMRALIDDSLDGADWFFDQWYGPYPRVNYRLGKLTDVPLADGRFQHRVAVFREGAVIREPVSVRLEDKDGEVKTVVWDSAAHTDTLVWTSKAPLEHVEIDPEHRVVEAAELTAGHPFQDNTNRLPWRPPMFTRLVVWGDLTTGEPYVQLGFWLRRRYDVTNVFSLDLDYTPSAYGGAFSYYRWFGKKRTLNARSWLFGPSVAATRYRAVEDRTLDMPDDAKMAATMGAVGFALARDTRVYGWDPLSGTAVGLSGSYAFGQSDDGRLRHVGRVSFQAGTLQSPGIRNTVAIYGGAFGVMGDPVAAHMASLSNRRVLRGFETDETYGRFGLWGVVEYRHTIVDAAHVKAPAYSWFDRFQGALFVGGGTMSEPSGLGGMFEPHRIFTEVGYGLRIHLLLFGFQQYIIAFDFAYPLTPLDRTRIQLQSDGTEALVNRAPYKLLFGITQTF